MLSAAKQANAHLASSSQRQIAPVQRAVFSFYHNFHHPTHFYCNGKKYDTDFNTDLYKPHIRAFLTKRWTTKREIPPKIAVMEDMGEDYAQVYF